MTRGLVWCVGVFMAVCATDGAGQSSTNTPDPATLRRSSFAWSQAEREFCFAHWDDVYSGRLVPRGVQVRGLSSGTTLVSLRPGTAGAQALDRFIEGEHLLGVLVTSATKQTRAAYLSAKMWSPYGMEQSAVWATDRRHHELAGCCLQAGLRGYARFGQFVLDGGRIDGHAIVPDGWFEAATQRQTATASIRVDGWWWQSTARGLWRRHRRGRRPGGSS